VGTVGPPDGVDVHSEAEASLSSRRCGCRLIIRPDQAACWYS
jgi:hypothetical protein